MESNAAKHEIDDSGVRQLPPPPYHSYSLPPSENPRFHGLAPTEFQIAERRDREHGTSETLLVIPGFGVSAAQIGVDSLLWNKTSRYSRIVTHPAVNYDTTHDYVLYQYLELIKSLDAQSFNILAISLGGSTAIQLLFFLQQHAPELYARVKKLVTLVSPVVKTDLSARWQTVLGFCRQLAELNRRRDETGIFKRIALDALVGGIQPLVRRSSLEAETDDEVRNVFAYAGGTFNGARDMRLSERHGELPGIEIVSFGLEEDAMAPNTQACLYANPPGRHRTFHGKHTPRFYAEAKALYDGAILEELR